MTADIFLPTQSRESAPLAAGTDARVVVESAEGSRIIQAGVVALDAGGGAGHPDRVSSTEIPARAGDAGAALNPRNMGVSSLNCPAGDGAFAVPPDPAGAFWGTLTPYEDRWLWRMRAHGLTFEEARRDIEHRRTMKAMRGQRGGLKRWARHYRAQIRRERGA